MTTFEDIARQKLSLDAREHDLLVGSCPRRLPWYERALFLAACTAAALVAAYVFAVLMLSLERAL